MVARNPGAEGQSSSAVVDIQVLNINDQPPDITVDYLYNGLLPEDQSVVSADYGCAGSRKYRDSFV